MYRPRRSTRPTPGSSATSSDSALACRARRRAAAIPDARAREATSPSPNPARRESAGPSNPADGRYAETDRDRVPSLTSPRSFHPSRVAPPLNLRATRCPTPRRLIARIPPPPPPPPGPSRGISTPRVSAGRGYPVPEGGAPLGIVAGWCGAAVRAVREERRWGGGGRNASHDAPGPADEGTPERRRRADTRESRRGCSRGRSREARRDAFPDRARASRPLPGTESREHLLERPERNPPGIPGTGDGTGGKTGIRGASGPRLGSLGTIIPLSLANSSSSSSTRFSAWGVRGRRFRRQKTRVPLGEAGGGGARPGRRRGSRGDSDGPTSGADSSAFAAVVSAIPALRSFAHWCTSPAYFFATCTRMMLNLDRIFPSRTHRYCLFPRYSTCADKTRRATPRQPGRRRRVPIRFPRFARLRSPRGGGRTRTWTRTRLWASGGLGGRRRARRGGLSLMGGGSRAGHEDGRWPRTREEAPKGVWAATVPPEWTGGVLREHSVHGGERSIHRDAGGLRVLRHLERRPRGHPERIGRRRARSRGSPRGRRISRGVRFGRQRGEGAEGSGRTRPRSRPTEESTSPSSSSVSPPSSPTARPPSPGSASPPSSGLAGGVGRPPARASGSGYPSPLRGCGTLRAAMREHSRPRAELLAAKLGNLLHPRLARSGLLRVWS